MSNSATLTPAADASVAVSANAKRVAIVLIGIALVLPLWLVKYPPLIDYPNHLARGYVLHHLHEGTQIFADWYAPDWGPNPYLTEDILLQGLQSVFGIYTAGRLLLSLCVLAVPVATWFFLHEASPGNEVHALWSLVVAYDTNFLMGFLSFQLSMALCLAAIAAWIAYLKAPKLSTWLLLLVLITALYFTHIGGFAVAGVVIVLYTSMQRRGLANVCKAVLLFVPGFVFFMYVKLHGWSQRGFDYSSWHFSAKLVSLTTPFRGHSRIVDLICISIFVACLAIALIGNREAKFSRIWLWISGVILLIHWAVPERYGDLASIDTRFSPFAFLIGLAAFNLGKRKPLLVYGALLVFVLKTGYITTKFRSEQQRLEVLAAALPTIPERAHVLSCVKQPPPEDLWVKHSEYHFWAYGVISRGWLSPSLFHQKGVQPLTLKKHVYLADEPDDSCALSQSWDWQRLRQEYDYVWAYDVPALSPGLSKVASPAYTSDKLVIYAIHKDLSAAAKN